MASLSNIADIYLQNEAILRQRMEDDHDSYQKFLAGFDMNRIQILADSEDLLTAIEEEWPLPKQTENGKKKVNLLAEAKKPMMRDDNQSNSEHVPSEMITPIDIEKFKEPKRFNLGYSGGVKINSSPRHLRDSPKSRTSTGFSSTFAKGRTIAESNSRAIGKTVPAQSKLTKGFTLGESLAKTKSREVIEGKSNVQFNLEGEKTLNQYVFKQHLGKGAFGVVELVIDDSTGIEYVIFALLRLPNVKA